MRTTPGRRAKQRNGIAITPYRTSVRLAATTADARSPRSIPRSGAVGNGRLRRMAVSGFAASRRHRCAYEWVAPVSRRTMRQTRCERCSTERADGKNSLAALHPTLVREWDVERNGALRPDRIKATYDKAVGWICADDPEHPPYRMSPFTRAKRPIGCSLCRRRAKAEERRAA